MYDPMDLNFLEVALSLKWCSGKMAQELLEQQEANSSPPHPSSLKEQAVQRGFLTPSQRDKISSILQRGYFFCKTCQLVYPLPPSGCAEKMYHCNQCKGAMELKKAPGAQGGETSSTHDNTEKTISSENMVHPQKPSPKDPIIQFTSLKADTYQVEALLGKGGYGRVYRVSHPFLNRPSALKILLKKKAGHPIRQKRFLREIRITAQLEHPNIMPVYEGGYLEDGSPYFVMKELRGGTLKDLLQAPKKSSRKNLMDVFLKVCDAMDYAHSRGVTHRDLKPPNIAVGEFGEVMVLDWGIASSKAMDDMDLSLKETAHDSDEIMMETGENLTMGAMLGTAGYMSPEQIRGKDADGRSDIFSLGVILYEILTRNLPFEGTNKNKLVETMLNNPLPPHLRCPELNIPLELSAITMKALEKKKYRRYQKVRTLKEDIERFEEGYSVTAKKDSLFQRSRKWVRRNKTATVGLLLGLVILIIGLGGWNYLRKTEELAQSRAEEFKKQKITQILGDVAKFFKTTPKAKDFERQNKNKKGADTPEDRRLRLMEKYMKMRNRLEHIWRMAPQNNQLKNNLYQLERELGLLALGGKNYLLSRFCFERCANLGKVQESKKLLIKLEARKNKKKKEDFQKIARLMALLIRAPQGEMVDEYVTELVRMGEAHVSRELIGYLQKGTLWQRLVAIKALGKLGHGRERRGGKEVVEWLLDRLKKINPQKNMEEAENLIWALGRLRDGRANDLVYQVRWKMGVSSPFWYRTEIPYGWLPIKKASGKTVASLFRRASMKLDKGDNPGALADFKEVIRLNPKYASAYNSIGIAYIRMDKTDKAIANYTQAIQLDPKLVEAVSNRGLAYESLEKYTQAIADFTRAIKLDPNYASAYNNRGYTWRIQKKYDRAISDFSYAIYLKPNYYLAYYYRADAKYYKGDTDGAIDDYTRAIAINSKNASPYLYRALTWERKREYDKALADYTQAIRLDPTFAKAYSLRGLLHKIKGNLDGALGDYTQAIKLDPTYHWAYNNRAVIWKQKKQYKKALADYSKVIQLRPSSAFAYYIRGRVWIKLKKYKKALADQTKAISLDKDYAYAYYNRAKAFQKLNLPSKAVQDFKTFIKLRPHSSFVAKAKNYIKTHSK